MPSTLLSPNFSLEELTRSDTARLFGIPNTPTDMHMIHLRALANFLELVRIKIGGKPIFVESAYRNPEVNALVRGVPDSDHCMGYAADIQAAYMTDLDLAKTIRDSSLSFDQLILEAGRTVHISINPRLRRQVLRQPGPPGTPVYEGLEG